MIPFFAVIKKEIASVLRDRTIVIAILIQLFIASFSSTLLMGMLVLYDSDTILEAGAQFKIGLVGLPDETLASLLTSRGLTVTRFDSQPEAEAAFRANQVNAIIADAGRTGPVSEIKLYLPDSDTLSSLIRMVIQEPLKQYENSLRIQNGVDVRYSNLKGKASISFEFIYSVLLPMLMFFPAFVAGSMSVDSLTEEVESNTLPTLLSAPLTVNALIGAKITAVVFLSVIQCAAWLVLLTLNGIALQNIGWILLMGLLLSGITSTLAASGAVLLRDRERSQFIYSLSLLAVTALSTLLNLSPITTLSRLAIGDAYTNGWNVMVYAAIWAGLFFVLTRLSRRLTR